MKNVFFVCAIILQIAGCNELDMKGHNACNNKKDCPSGQICSYDNTCVLPDFGDSESEISTLQDVDSVSESTVQATDDSDSAIDSDSVQYADSDSVTDSDSLLYDDSDSQIPLCSGQCLSHCALYGGMAITGECPANTQCCVPDAFEPDSAADSICDRESWECATCRECATRFLCNEPIETCMFDSRCAAYYTCTSNECCDGTNCLEGENWNACSLHCQNVANATTDTLELYQNITKCISCNSCTRSCVTAQPNQYTFCSSGK